MSTRHDQLADAAIRVLGTQGIRQLTHRAVDAEAELPVGSTSNYFRTRQALISAVVGRLVVLDRIDWHRLTGLAQPADTESLAMALAGFVRLATGPERSRTLARYALFLESAVRPDLRDQLGQGRADIAEWATASLRQVGSPDPQGHLRLLFRYLDGVILHQVAACDPHFDPLPDLRLLLTNLIGGSVRP
ncbi:MAG TPA: TetR/AcrR family transcriptional regulator [Micromonosporaceae bacterium]|nr:TetR/AcrR family transcriptional regulator [Micromonosporaceae bacterium]